MKTTVIKFSIVFIFFFMVGISNLYSGTISKELPHFKKIVTGPYINLKLIYGEAEKIDLKVHNIDPEKLNIEVKHGTLRIYLDEAMCWPKNERYKNDNNRYELYRDAEVFVTITFRELKALKVTGEEIVSCPSSIRGKEFKLNTIGETRVFMESIQVGNLKIRSIGENEIRILSGRTGNSHIRLIGENTINMESVFSGNTKCLTIGENELDCNSEDEIRVFTIGESAITQYGEARFRKMGIGENNYSYAFKRL